MGCCGSTSNNTCDIRCCCCCPRVPCKISCCTWCFSSPEYSKLRCDLCIRAPTTTHEEIQATVSQEVKYVQYSLRCFDQPMQTIPCEQHDKGVQMGESALTSDSTEQNEISVDKSSLFHPFTTYGLNLKDPLEWINGYENENVEGLEEALKVFENQIDNFSECIKEAKENCNQKGPSDMTHDESAAIYLYSMRNNKNNVGYLLDKAWKSEDRSAMLPWLKYLKLLHDAYEKLPDAKGEVWQGISFDDKYESQLKTESIQLFTGMNVCAPTATLIKNYLKKEKHEKMLLIGYKECKAKEIAEYGESGQSEYFLWPGHKIDEIKCEEDKGTLIFHLSKKAEPQEPDKIIPQYEHFYCANPSCQNACHKNHPTFHCLGLKRLDHSCKHHCGPSLQCDACKNYEKKVYQCLDCHRRFCRECCFY